MTTAQDERASSFAQASQLPLNRMQDAAVDRKARVRAVDELRNKANESGLSSDNVLSLVHKPLLKLCADPVEKCREVSLRFLLDFIPGCENVAPLLPFLIPVALSRTAALNDDPDVPIVEPAEEIRLMWGELVAIVIDRAGETTLAMFVDDIAAIAAKLLLDPFQDEACKFVTAMTNKCQQKVAMNYALLTRHLLANITHKHSSVRVATLQALNALALAEPKVLDEEAVFPALERLTLDGTPSVRNALFQLLADWLWKLRGRYGYAPKSLPLFLTSLSDPVDSVQKQAQALWDEIGKEYEYEYEDQVKKECDVHEAIDAQVCVRNAVSKRYRVGCRHLMRDNTQKTIQKLVEWADSWTLEARQRGIRTLVTAIQVGEGYVTGYVHLILSAIVKHVMDDDDLIRSGCQEVARELGAWVDVTILLDVLVPQITQTNIPSIRIGALIILENIIRGIPDGLWTMATANTWIQSVNSVLTHEDVCTTDDSATIHALAKCTQLFLESLSKNGGVLDDPYGMFKILVRFSSFTTEPLVIAPSALISMEALIKISRVNTIDDVYEKFATDFMQDMIRSCKTWTSPNYTPDIHILMSFLENCGKICGSPAVMDPLLLNIGPHICSILTEESQRTENDESSIRRDVELQIFFVKMMLSLFKKSPETSFNSHALFSWQEKPDIALTYSDAFLSKIIRQSLVWRGGRPAMALRRQAIELFFVWLQNNLVHPDALRREIGSGFDSTPSSILHVFSTTLDDDDSQTRDFACRVYTSLLQFDWFSGVLDEERCKVIYPDLLKRLDDALDSIRIQTALTLKFFLQRSKCCDNLDVIHYETILKGLLVHMDDQNTALQETICEAIIAGATTNGGVLPKEMIRSEIEKVRERHRSKRYIDAVLSSV